MADSSYLLCEVMIVKLGFEADDDEIFRIDFKGDYGLSNNTGFIPSPHDGLKEPGGLSGRYDSCTEAARILADEFKLTHGSNLFFDVAVLSREMANQKNFSKVYSKLKI